MAGLVNPQYEEEDSKPAQPLDANNDYIFLVSL